MTPQCSLSQLADELGQVLEECSIFMEQDCEFGNAFRNPGTFHVAVKPGGLALVFLDSSLAWSRLMGLGDCSPSPLA